MFVDVKIDGRTGLLRYSFHTFLAQPADHIYAINICTKLEKLKVEQ